MAFSDYKTDPNLNTQIAGQYIGENCLPSVVNNAIRQIMADGKALADSVAGGYGGIADLAAQRDKVAGTTDKAAFAALIAAGKRRIYLPGGKGSGAGGQYLLGASPWTNPDIGADDIDDYIESRGNLGDAGVEVFGDGIDKTIVFQDGDNYIFTYNSLSSDPANNAKGFYFHDMTLRGAAVERGFAEPVHCVAIHGFTGATFERVKFQAFRGDGLWASMGPKQHMPRYSSGLRVVDCVFDGVNKDNRNALSVEACDGIWLINNEVIRCSRDDMPGPFDFEPRDDVAYQCRNVHVIGNSFRDFNSAAINVYINDPDYYTQKMGAFVIAGNMILDGDRGIDFAGAGGSAVAASVSMHRVMVSDNIFTNVEEPFRIQGCYGMRITCNVFQNCGTGRIGGFSARLLRRLIINDNIFYQCGRTNGVVLAQDDPVAELEVVNNRIWDCGLIVSGSPTGTFYLARSGAIDVILNDNRVRDPGGKMIRLAYKLDEAGAVSTSSEKIGNRCFDNNIQANDNINPPPPVTGLYGMSTLSAGSIAANSTAFYDVTVAGATANSFWKALLNKAYVASDIVTIYAYTLSTSPNTVRVVVKNESGSTALTIPAGTMLKVQEAQ